MLSENSPAHLSDSDLHEAFAILRQDSCCAVAPQRHQLRQLMLAELDTQQARWSPAAWRSRLLSAPPGRTSARA